MSILGSNPNSLKKRNFVISQKHRNLDKLTSRLCLYGVGKDVVGLSLKEIVLK